MKWNSETMGEGGIQLSSHSPPFDPPILQKEESLKSRQDFSYSPNGHLCDIDFISRNSVVKQSWF